MDNFKEKLELILNQYQLTASSFAEKIGVQRSSMSHLLSGRNKPSLDFIIKITEHFPEVDLYWILKDEGAFPKRALQIDESIEETSINTDLFSDSDNQVTEKILESDIQKPSPPSEIVDQVVKIETTQNINDESSTNEEIELAQPAKIEEVISKNVNTFVGTNKEGLDSTNQESFLSSNASNSNVVEVATFNTSSTNIETVLILQSDGTFKEYKRSTNP